MNVLLVSTDLLAASQLEGAANQAGARLTVAPPAKALAVAEADPPRLVALDLASPLGELAALIDRLRSLEPQPAVIAYGPHVQEAKLRAAADAGCDEVLTRGQFHRQARAVIARYASPGSGSGAAGSS